MKKAAVRLEGSRSDIIAVARTAARAVAADDSAKRALFPALRVLHQGSRTLAGWPEDTAAQGTSLWRAAWGVLLSTGLVAALTGAVMFGPADRKNAFISAEQAVAVGLPAAQIGIVLVAVLLFLPVPTWPAARYGSVCTMLVGLVVAGLFVVRIVTGAADERGFTPGQVATWVPAIALMAALLAVLAWRLNALHRRAAGPGVVPSPRARKEQSRHLRTMAERLAGAAANTAVLEDWNNRLAQLERQGISPSAIAQARQMEPAAWLAWVFYDGDSDVSEVLSR